MSLLDSVLSSLTTSTVALGLSQQQLIKTGRRLEGIWNGNTLNLFITGNIETFYDQDAVVHAIDVPIYSEQDINWLTLAAKARTMQEISMVLNKNDQIELASIWDLFIVCTHDSFSIPEYLDWLKYIPIPNLPSIAPWTSKDYWPVMIKFLVRGDFSNALVVLRKYQDKSIVQDLSMIVESYPDRGGYATFNDFVEAWEVWKMRVEKDATDVNIQLVMRILAGDKAEINNISFLSWKEKLGAYCLFCSPHIGFSDMTAILKSVLGSDTRDNDVEDMYLSLVKRDFMALLRVASRTDAWLVSHLADYLVKEELLDENQLHTYASSLLKQTKFSIREWYILEFADAIFPLSWALSFEYLLKCTVNGRKRISMYAARLSPDQINMADLENFLMSNNFMEECKLLYAVAGRSFLSKGDLGNSLSFFAESKNAGRVFTVVTKFLESNPRLIDYENILAPINGSTLVTYDALVFLSRYRDFLKYLEAGSLIDAGNYLTNLLFSGSIPRQLLRYTYADIIYLLEKASIDAPGCLEFLRMLEDEIQTPIIASLRSKLIHQLSLSWK